MTRPDNSAALAQVLKEHPPTPDDVARARMEKRLIEATLIEATLRPSETGSARASSGARIWVGGGVLAAAAAVMFGWFALWPDGAVPGAQAEFQTYDDTTRQRGTLEVGSTLRTDERTEGDIRVADSRIHIGPGSLLYLGELSSDRLSLDLTRGEIRVEFHPRVRGRERMTIRTPHASVEVVGTVFVVRASESFTEVSVTEGQVRVVPEGGEARLVGAHDAVRVPEDRTAVAPSTQATAAAPADGDEAGPLAPPTERERNLVTPAQRLSRAREMVRQGETDRAEVILRGVTADRTATARIRAEAYTLLGDVLGRERRFDDARAAYEGAVRQHAGSLSQLAIYALGRMQEREMNEPAAARASYRRYVEEAPGGPLVGQARQALCRLGDTSACAGSQ